VITERQFFLLFKLHREVNFFVDKILRLNIYLFEDGWGMGVIPR
jgi:hypothetical protein